MPLVSVLGCGTWFLLIEAQLYDHGHLSKIDNLGQERESFAELITYAEALSMNVHLTPELAQLVQTKVQGGRYNSASEVIREALRLLEERDMLLELRKEAMRQQIEAGWASLRRGEGIDGEAWFAALERQEHVFTPLEPERT